MEISSDFDLPFEETLPAEPETSELIGRVLLAGSTSLAAGAFVPVLFKKKRTYTFVPPTGLAAAPEIAPPPLIIEESPQPLPAPLDAPSFPRTNPEEKKTVVYIFNAIANWSYWNLINNQGDLNRKGDSIEHLHPFALLLTIPKEAMQKIFASPWMNSFQIKNVLGGIEKGMLREGKSRNLTPHIPAFAREMKKEEHQIGTLIQTQKWLALVHYLFDI